MDTCLQVSSWGWNIPHFQWEKHKMQKETAFLLWNNTALKLRSGSEKQNLGGDPESPGNNICSICSFHCPSPSNPPCLPLRARFPQTHSFTCFCLPPQIRAGSPAPWSWEPRLAWWVLQGHQEPQHPIITRTFRFQHQPLFWNKTYSHLASIMHIALIFG